MIPARKSVAFDAWFSRVAEGRIAGAFSVVRVAGLEHLRAAAAKGPVLVVSNHTSWWDPLVVIYLSSRVLKTDGYALMDGKNLERLPFFARVGGFGVDLTSAPDGARAIRYGASLLDRPGRVVWVFPQGRERPVTERPLGFVGGAAALARVAKSATCIPVAFRYEFGAAEKPELLLSVGEPLSYERDVARALASQEAAVEAALVRIEQAAHRQAWESDGFEVILRERRGLGHAFGVLAERALAWLTRPSASTRRLHEPRISK